MLNTPVEIVFGAIGLILMLAFTWLVTRVTEDRYVESATGVAGRWIRPATFRRAGLLLALAGLALMVAISQVWWVGLIFVALGLVHVVTAPRLLPARSESPNTDAYLAAYARRHDIDRHG